MLTMRGTIVAVGLGMLAGDMLRAAGEHSAEDLLPSVRVPTLVVAGGKSPAWMRNAMQALARVLPSATHRTLEGQTHMVKAKALAPVLAEFFGN
jgi:pimeloyl-ACP methyl ester carboxylesterase